MRIGNTMPLKYLFTAKFANGKVYQQNADDRSVTEPDKRSCYTDVRKEIDSGNALVRFELTGNGHTYAVDTTDGHFEIDGVPFIMHANAKGPFKLVYTREHTVVGDAQQGVVVHTVFFLMGWQAVDASGKEHNRVMRIT